MNKSYVSLISGLRLDVIRVIITFPMDFAYIRPSVETFKRLFF